MNHLLLSVLLATVLSTASEGAAATGLSAAMEAAQAAGNVPWSPAARCALNPTHDKGLHPEALSALRGLSVAHRVTQGINSVVAPGNVHYVDVTLNGQAYTGAADISVRCLTANQIKVLLERLADVGFAGWYRKPGADGWTGPPHIHAIWVGCSLKPVLQRQVESWLDGRNGLGPDKPYAFWQPSASVRGKVQTLYRAFNK